MALVLYLCAMTIIYNYDLQIILLIIAEYKLMITFICWL